MAEAPLPGRPGGLCSALSPQGWPHRVDEGWVMRLAESCDFNEEGGNMEDTRFLWEMGLLGRRRGAQGKGPGSLWALAPVAGPSVFAVRGCLNVENMMCRPS